MEHLVIIIDRDKKIEPKKFSCSSNSKTQKEAVDSAKKAYENKYQNFNYDSYYFLHD